MNTASAAAASPLAASGLLSVMGSLLVVLALIFVLAWAMRRLQGLRAPGGKLLRVHAGLQVGAKERVLIIQAGDTHLLVGVASGQVRTLHVFTEPPRLDAPQGPAGGEPTAFSARLRSLLDATRP